MVAAPSADASTSLSSVAVHLQKAFRVGLWRYVLHSGSGGWSDEVFQLLDLPISSDPPEIFELLAKFGIQASDPSLTKVTQAFEQREKFSIEHSILTASGQRRWLRAYGTPIQQDGVQQMVGSLHDVTEERAASRSAVYRAGSLPMPGDSGGEDMRFRELFDQAPVFVTYGSTPDLRFEYANPLYCELVGDRDLVGKTVSEALPEVIAQGLIQVLRAVYTTGKPYVAIEEPMRLYNQQGFALQKYLTYIYQPIRDADDEITGILCIGYDVTDECLARQEAEELRDELLRSSHLTAMGTMAATLAHELNQPLTSLVMFTGGLLRNLGKTPVPAMAETLEAVQSEALRASEIMRRMRAIGAGRAIRQEPLNLADLFTEALKFPLRTCEDVEVTYDLQHTGSASGDSLQVQQVVTNFVRNACEAMADQETKSIELATADQVGEILVSIADTGPGVPNELLPKMFEGTQSTKKDGMGIGLAICRTIIEAQGGRVGAFNRPGKGATFWFRLPRHKDRDPTSSAGEA